MFKEERRRTCMINGIVYSKNAFNEVDCVQNRGQMTKIGTAMLVQSVTKSDLREVSTFHRFSEFWNKVYF